MLDLGCNDRPRNPYGHEELYGVDLSPMDLAGVHYRQANLAFEPIPFPDRHFDCVSAFDFIEHVPRQMFSPLTGQHRLPFIELMNEIWRVLKPDGRFYAVTPAYPAAAAFQDPTHVNFITDKTHEYFCGANPGARMYGFVGRFDLIRAELVIPKMAESAEQTTRKQWYRWSRRLLRPGRLSHMLWEFSASQ